ncbi:MAG: helix-turn-helix domain-containing protein [bacterium]
MRVAKYQCGMDYVSVPEISVSLGFSERTIRGWLKSGMLPFLKIKRQMLVPVKEYQRFIRQHTFNLPETAPPGDDDGACIPAFGKVTEASLAKVQKHLEHLETHGTTGP